MKSGGAKIGFFHKMRIKKIRSVRKNSTPSPWKPRKKPHPRFSAQRAPEGQKIIY